MLTIDWQKGIMDRAYGIQDALARDPILSCYVDAELHIPQPYVGSKEIKLVIIGQDPTVQNPERRKEIGVALGLDSSKPLRRFLSVLCTGLGCTLDNVYATNAAKCFFRDPPTTVFKRDEVDVLERSADWWLPLLREELAQFPMATVVSLGQPVLSMLVKRDYPRILRHYWGYKQGWKSKAEKGWSPTFRAIESSASTVDRHIWPYIHLTSTRGRGAAFYNCYRDKYLMHIHRARQARGDSACKP
jgi:uracil-DNA glycosylase